MYLPRYLMDNLNYMYILEVASGDSFEVELVLASSKDMPLKKAGWIFDWRSTIIKENTRTYILRLRFSPNDIQGIIHLKEADGMLIMDLVEVAPDNLGTKGKKYDRVAGILIAFACRESFKLDNEYRGYLTFQSKSELIELYNRKYGAKLAFGQRMYIDPHAGEKLMIKYLKFENE